MADSGFKPTIAHVGRGVQRFSKIPDSHTLLFGINKLRSGELPHCCEKSRSQGALVQLPCNLSFKRLPCRCTPITSANDGASQHKGV